MKKWLFLLLPVMFVFALVAMPTKTKAQTVVVNGITVTNACYHQPATGQCNPCGIADPFHPPDPNGQFGTVNPTLVIDQKVTPGRCVLLSEIAPPSAAAALSVDPDVARFQQSMKICPTNLSSDCSMGFATKAVLSQSLVLMVGDNYNNTTSHAAIPTMSHMIGMLYTPPATANDYVADLMHGAGIATPAYAQGLGYASLAPVLETWKVFRTIAYFFYVIIFLVIGFMIMFRQKIGSQTVVSVQQALPKLLISLIAVTFSYAIAGLLIEVMYIAMFLILNVFLAGPLGSTSIQGANGATLQNFGTNSNIFDLAGLIFNGTSLGNANTTVGSLVNGMLATNKDNAWLGNITGLAVMVVFALALLFSIFSLFFELLKTYVMIIIMIVTSPLTLMMGALPGNNAFANWLKGLLFNLAVFPVILVVIVMAFLLQTSITANGGFLPPYIGGGGASGAIGPLLGLGILLILPDIVKKVKAMAPKGPFDDLGNQAVAAMKKGYSGGELIPGLGFTNTKKYGMTGENLLAKPFFGTKESQDRAKAGKFTVAGRGAIGGGYELGKAELQRLATAGRGSVLPFGLGQNIRPAPDMRGVKNIPQSAAVPPTPKENDVNGLT